MRLISVYSTGALNTIELPGEIWKPFQVLPVVWQGREDLWELWTSAQVDIGLMCKLGGIWPWAPFSVTPDSSAGGYVYFSGLWPCFPRVWC